MELSPFAIKAIQLLLSLSLLIVLHEFGHYIPAKLFKTRVEKFFLFFDVKFALFKKKIGETVYGIGWLPLGGYVKISGMIDESMDKEQMAQEPKDYEFRSKPAWQRLIIMVGGVIVNIIVGFAIYAMVLFVWGSNSMSNDDMPEGLSVAAQMQDYGFQNGDQILSIDGEPLDNNLTMNNRLKINNYLMMRDLKEVEVRHTDGSVETIAIPEDIGTQLFKKGVMRPFSFYQEAVVDTVIVGGLADKNDILKGDRILRVNDSEIESWSDFQETIRQTEGDDVSLLLERNGNELKRSVTLDDERMLGISALPDVDFKKVEYGFGESLVKGISYGYDVLRDYVSQFKYVFTKEGATQVGGFGAIGNLFPDAWNWQAFWMTTALISIILAFMNILPIPALDGGHVMFLLYEIISGRKPGDKFMEYAQLIGFFIIIALVLFANGNDIYRWLFEQ